MKNEQSLWSMYLYMMCLYLYGLTKAGVMTATIEESMAIACMEYPPVTIVIVRGTRYSAIPVVSAKGVHDVYIAQGNMNGERFAKFVQECVLPILMPFNGSNPQSVVIMDNASIHHIQDVSDLIETQAGARLCYLPPYSPDLNPVEGIFSQAKNIMKANEKLLQATTAPRAILAITTSQFHCWGHISHCGYF